jgi:iron complex outermembrane receptor protein
MLTCRAMLALGTGLALTPLAAVADPLPDIVVTAQKRPELAQAVPLSITTFDAGEFAGTGVKDLLQLAYYVPGMVFSRAPDDGLALSFRGIGTGARTQAFDQSVAVYLDGLFLAKGRLYTAALFDVERV